MVESDNGREFSRIEIPVRVELIGAEMSVVAETRDISMNGMLVRADQTLPEGSVCEIHITLGYDTETPLVIDAHGKIARSRGDTMAIHFTDVEVDGFTHLKNLVMYNAHDRVKAEHEMDEHVGIR